MNRLPLVSICSITYNHAPYIRQCLDGMLMQQTNFAFEIIINDDCSTDGTTEIIREYAEKYPEIIKPIFHEENQYQKGVRGIFAKFVFPKANGKYIAICEGDDYWTDPLKLQKQVDFLETHPDYSVCFHKCQSYIQAESKLGEIFPVGFNEPFTFDINYFLSRCSWITHPLTCLFRRSSINWETYNQCKITKDLSLFYFLLKGHKGYFLPNVMAVYRIHSGGVWSKATNDQRIYADLETMKSIHDVENSELSAKMLRLYFESSLKLAFLIQNYKKLTPYFKLITPWYGTAFPLKLLIHTIYKSIRYRLFHT